MSRLRAQGPRSKVLALLQSKYVNADAVDDSMKLSRLEAG